MSVEDQTYRLLSELELNEYETRAYLSVIEGGISVAREISDRASIPYAKVYQTLNDLIEKQLITGDEGRPKKFQARSPKEAITNRLNVMEKTWLETHTKRRKLLERILPELEALYNGSHSQEEEEIQGVWNITGLTNIVSRIIKIVQKAEDQVLIVAGDYPLFSQNFLRPIIDNTRVPIHLLCKSEPEDNTLFSSVKEKSNLGESLMIFVDEFAMATIVEVQKGKYSSGEFTAVLTQIREMVQAAKTTFGGESS